MKKDMGVAESCRNYLRMLLCGVTLFYVAVTVVVLPVYFKTETDYGSIGSDKSGFFHNWGFAAARMFGIVLVCYLFFALVCWWKENHAKKGKVLLLMDRLLNDLSLTDKFACFYLVILGLSYYYTEYRDTLLIGVDGWYMGFFPQLVFIGSYFAVSRLLRGRQVRWLFAGMLAVSAFVFALGTLNRFGINPLGMASSGPVFISTIGNINWYCGYWSVLFPLGAGAFVFYEKRHGEKGYRWKHMLLGCFAALGFATGVTQGSDSGILTLTGVILLTGCLSAGKEGRLKNFLQMLLIFCGVAISLAIVQFFFPEQNQYVTSVYTIMTKTPLPWMLCVLLLVIYLYLYAGRLRTAALRIERNIWWGFMGFVGIALFSFLALLVLNTLHPGSIGQLSENPFFTFNAKWGSSRGATWTLGMKTWFSQDLLHKLVGVGPDGMPLYIYSGADEALLAATREQFGASRLTNAHGEWITVLANTGILGLIGFAGMMLSGMARFFGNHKKSVLCLACGLSLFGYTLNNVFSFWQIMNITQMFVVLGMGECLLREGKNSYEQDSDCGR